MFPKTGKVFLDDGRLRGRSGAYAATLAAALREELGDSHRAVKTVIKWTGANERTVKNWLCGTSGPCGEHLILLAKHSDLVFEVLLLLADREDAMGTARLMKARQMLADTVALLDTLLAGEERRH